MRFLILMLLAGCSAVDGVEVEGTIAGEPVAWQCSGEGPIGVAEVGGDERSAHFSCSADDAGGQVEVWVTWAGDEDAPLSVTGVADNTRGAALNEDWNGVNYEITLDAFDADTGHIAGEAHAWRGDADDVWIRFDGLLETVD